MDSSSRSDKDKLKVLPNNGYAPNNHAIAEHLREQAKWMEESDCRPVRNVYLVVERCDGSVYQNSCGDHTDFARNVGVITVSLVRSIMGVED